MTDHHHQHPFAFSMTDHQQQHPNPPPLPLQNPTPLPLQFAAFSMTDHQHPNPHPLQFAMTDHQHPNPQSDSAAANHHRHFHYDPAIWAVAGNDRSAAWYAGNPRNLESEFSRLSLTPETPPPVYISSRRYVHDELSLMNMNRNLNSELTRWSPRNEVLLRPRPRQRWNIAELKRGRIFLAAKDQYGCRFLKEKLDEGNAEDIRIIFMEIKDNVHELMVDQIGNHLIHKFVDVCNQEEMNQLVLQFTNDQHKFIATCSDMYGTRSVQKLMDNLTTTEQRLRMISSLSRIVVALTKNPNAHHIIQHCLKVFSFEEIEHILNVVADNCLEIATDQHGCCVLQQCLGHARGEPRQRLIAQITSNALMLSEHPYGNYVVQYVLGLKIQQATRDILAQLAGKHVSLSFNKYGSNVVEKCLKECEEHQVGSIIEELINSPNFVRVLQDPYGNYVGQSAIAKSKGAIREALMKLIYENHSSLHSHPHGKRVLQCTKLGRRMNMIYLPQ